MRPTLCCMLVLLLTLPALHGDEKPKAGPKVQYDALVKKFEWQRRLILGQLRQSNGEERNQGFANYTDLCMEFAEKFYQLAEDNPKDPIAIEALIRVVQSDVTSPLFMKAAEKVTPLVPKMSVKDLVRHVGGMQRNGPPAFLASAYKQAEKEITDQEAGDLLAVIATCHGNPAVSKKALELLIDTFPEHKRIEQICTQMGHMRIPQAAETLKIILEKSSETKLKAAAALGLAQGLAAQVDELSDKQSEADKKAAEAEKYLGMVIDQFAKDNPAQLQEAQRALNALRTLRVGKVAPNITAPDLDGKVFKLSDYRGKVVLLDFWGNWCGASHARYPQKRSLVKKMADKPFALVGVNTDPDLIVLKKVREEEKITWRSFWNGTQGTDGPISTAWHVQGWPTLYLIDHKGVIRHKWQGTPGDEELYKPIEKLVEEAKSGSVQP